MPTCTSSAATWSASPGKGSRTPRAGRDRRRSDGMPHLAAHHSAFTLFTFTSVLHRLPSIPPRSGDGSELRRTGRCMTLTETRSRDLIAALDDASLSRFHLRAVLVSGMGFFTDAYDLFVIGIASTLIAAQWNLSSGRLALLNSTMLLAAFLGACVFGRFADLTGRKRVYWIVAAIMVAGALGSAFSPSYWVLIGFRFLLGFGVGGDYPVSAVLMSEYANRKDRGKLV